MNRFYTVSVFALTLLFSIIITTPASAQRASRKYITYQTFYDEMSPYGQWISFPRHGYVWRPNIGAGFRPYYSGGHWVWNDRYQWMWVSDYAWGWAAFHYGRWFFDDFYGWLWVPGYEWSPAWVAWRGGGDYYGWAPLQPGFDFYYMNRYDPPVDYWCFAPSRYINSSNIYNYYVPYRQNNVYLNNTTIINNYYYSGNRNSVYCNGPSRVEAERYVGRMHPVQIRESYTQNTGGYNNSNNEVNIYRPAIRSAGNADDSPQGFESYRGGYNNTNTVRRDENTRTEPQRPATVFDRDPERMDNGQRSRRERRIDSDTNPQIPQVGDAVDDQRGGNRRIDRIERREQPVMQQNPQIDERPAPPQRRPERTEPVRRPQPAPQTQERAEREPVPRTPAMERVRDRETESPRPVREYRREPSTPAPVQQRPVQEYRRETSQPSPPATPQRTYSPRQDNNTPAAENRSERSTNTRKEQ